MKRKSLHRPPPTGHKSLAEVEPYAKPADQERSAQASKIDALHGRWRPVGDSNPCYRRERAVSWASRRTGQWPETRHIGQAPGEIKCEPSPPALAPTCVVRCDNRPNNGAHPPKRAATSCARRKDDRRTRKFSSADQPSSLSQRNPADHPAKPRVDDHDPVRPAAAKLDRKPVGSHRHADDPRTTGLLERRRRNGRPSAGNRRRNGRHTRHQHADQHHDPRDDQDAHADHGHHQPAHPSPPIV